MFPSLPEAALGGAEWVFALESLSLSSHLRHPPSRTHEQEPPVMKEFWRLALKSVPNKLEYPADYEE